MTKKDQIGQMKEAQDLIAEALGLIRDATGEDVHVEQYMCSSLSVMIGEGKYCSYNLTIETVIEGIEDGEYSIKDDGDDFCPCCGSYMNGTGKCPDPDCENWIDEDEDEDED